MKKALGTQQPVSAKPPTSPKHGAGHGGSFWHLPWGMLLMVLSMGNSPGADLLRWDVTGTSGITGSGMAAAPAAGVSGSVLTGGGTTGMSNTPANTWNRTFPETSDFAQAQAAGHYFSFTTSAEPGYTVTISGMAGLTLSRTTVGPTMAGLFYSQDGGATFVQTGSTVNLTQANSLTPVSAAFQETFNTTPLVIAGGETVHWRIVVYGGSGNRLGIGKAATDDLILTGTSVPDVAVHRLLWTGSGSQTWDMVPTNRNWADTALANAPAPFAAGDHAAINLPGTIQVDGLGVIAGDLVAGNETGSVNLAGGGISGISLTKTGAGTLALSGFNTFTGGASVTGGILQLESGGALGSTPLALNHSTLRLTPDVLEVTNPVSFGREGTTIETGGNVTLSGGLNSFDPATDTGNPLIKSGPGTLTISSTSTKPMGSQMTLGLTGGAVELDIPEGGVIFTGNGQRNLSGACTWDAPVSFGGGIVMLHGGSISGTGPAFVMSNTSIRSRLNFGAAVFSIPVEVPAGVVLGLDSANGNNHLAVTGPVSGDGGLNKTGNGTVRLESAGTWTGPTIIDAGTLRVGTGTNGTLGTGEIIINGGTLWLNRSDGVALANAISGPGNLMVSTGAGNATTLGGDCSYGGTTTVAAGTLRIDGNNSGAAGTLTVNAGAFLGGNGTVGAAVVLQAGGGLEARIRHWNGNSAGSDFDDLAVGSLDAGGSSVSLLVRTGGLTNFSETAKSFPILLAAGSITNFDPANVSVSAPDFPGTGSWTLTQTGGVLQLNYLPGPPPGFELWVSGPPNNLSGDDALPGADPDHDGLANAMEFVLGGNPAAGNDTGLLPSVVLANNRLVFTFRRSDASAYLNPSVQYSPATGTWTTAVDGVSGITVQTGNEVVSGVREIIVSIPQALASGGRLFARLRVVVP